MAVFPLAFEQRRNAALARMAALVEEDARIAALWLQGSLAGGAADPLSDIDAYLAVEDAAFDEVFAARARIAERIGTILAWSDATTPGLRAIHCLLDGPVKLDLFFEPASKVAEQARPAIVVLVDKAGIGPRLRLGWEASRTAIARGMDTILRMTRQGAAWPIRLLHRGQWATLAMMKIDLINAQIAQLMAVQLDPAHYYTNPFSLYRRLRPDQQAEIDTLTRQALEALAVRDAAALRDVHLRVYDALVREGRAVSAALGIPYPMQEKADTTIRAFLSDAWPVDAPSTRG